MTPWAFCEDLSADEGQLEEQEAHHLLHVLRLSAGSSFAAFDGRGTEAQAVVTTVSRRDVKFQILSRTVYSRPLRASVTVAASPPKGDRLKWMVEKLTEIGVDRLILLNTQRTVVTPGDTRVDKLRANVVAACKQSRRPWLLEIMPLQPLEVVLEEFASQSDLRQLFIAHPDTDPVPRTSLITGDSRELKVLIGPEGGFTDQEITAAIHNGAEPLSWPGNILRIETAAIVFGALLIARTGLL
jgi:16S rRNA (uracil1498-N3)-methyltransferase